METNDELNFLRKKCQELQVENDHYRKTIGTIIFICQSTKISLDTPDVQQAMDKMIKVAQENQVEHLLPGLQTIREGTA